MYGTKESMKNKKSYTKPLTLRTLAIELEEEENIVIQMDSRKV